MNDGHDGNKGTPKCANDEYDGNITSDGEVMDCGLLYDMNQVSYIPPTDTTNQLRADRRQELAEQSRRCP